MPKVVRRRSYSNRRQGAIAGAGLAQLARLVAPKVSGFIQKYGGNVRRYTNSFNPVNVARPTSRTMSTQTQTKKSQGSTIGQRGATDTRNRYLSIGGKVKGSGKLRYLQTFNSVTGSQAGIQGCWDLFSVCSIDQIITNTGGTANNFQAGIPLAALDITSKNTGNNYVGVSTTATNTQPWIHVKRVDCDIDISNLANTAQQLDVYVFMATADGDELPLSVTFPESLVAEAQGVAQAGTGSTGTAYSSGGRQVYHPSTKPSGKYFNSQWKVLSVDHYKLASGEMTKLNLHIKINKALDIASLSNLHSQGIRYKKGVSIVVGCIQRGQVSVTEETNRASYDVSKTGFVTEAKYQCSIVEKARKMPVTWASINLPYDEAMAHINADDADAGFVEAT